MNMKKLIILIIMMSFTTLSQAELWWIGDDDGYGQGIPDNADHPGVFGYDGRSDAEKMATDGAQFTDTYSTSHPGFGPDDQGTVATFIFNDLGNSWTEGSMWFDMADFQATDFGAVAVTYNGIVQNWAFNDGYPNTVVRFFDLGSDVIDSINLLGSLTIEIDRNGSADFYGFDYALLSDRLGDDTVINPVSTPGMLALLLTGLVVLRLRK
jgi:hypothetical protein